MFIDSHCHIYKEYYEDIDSLMDDLKLKAIINNGCDKHSNKEVISLLDKYPKMYGAIGIHPETVMEYTDEDIKYIEDNIINDKVVAIGEIGLDYHYDKESKEKQLELFEKQLSLAEKYNIPVIIHSREATLDTIETLKKYNVRGVIHSFSGSYETAMIYIKMGFYLGINGVVTFKNSNLKDVISKIGLDNIILETDSPYLTPHPYRGEKNHPNMVIITANFIADLLNISPEKVEEITNKNNHNLFDI